MQEARDIFFGGAFDVKAQREPAQTHGHDNAYDQRGDIAHNAAHNETHIACRSGDGGDGIKVSTLENARNHAHKAVAQHAAAHRGEKAHHDAHRRCKAVDQRLVCSSGGVDADRDDVEQGNEFFGLVDDCRENIDDGCRGNGKRQRHWLVEDVDVAHLQRHVA